MENLGLHLRTATVYQNINLNSLIKTLIPTSSITLMADGGTVYKIIGASFKQEIHALICKLV